jgi:hypothetical protein
MPETGIEDLIRNPSGCTGPLIASVIFTLVFLVGIGLIASYCAPSPADSNSNVEGRAQEP